MSKTSISFSDGSCFIHAAVILVILSPVSARLKNSSTTEELTRRELDSNKTCFSALPSILPLPVEPDKLKVALPSVRKPLEKEVLGIRAWSCPDLPERLSGNLESPKNSSMTDALSRRAFWSSDVSIWSRYFSSSVTTCNRTDQP